MSSIDTTIPIKEVLVNRVSVPLVNTGGSNKLIELTNSTITELTAEDLNGATQIRRWLCYNCESIIGVEFPSTVLSIEAQAFNSCDNLKSVIFNEGLVRIMNNSFAYCISITDLVIPSTVTNMTNAFNGCSSLKTITLKSLSPPTIMSTSSLPSSITTIYIPTGTLSAYQSATNWSSFSSKFVEKDM